MFLGIVLHAALAFGTTEWVVHDTHRHESFGLLFAAIHGFRMPLFFMMSGFFTAMLWRRHGVRSLVRHRFRRVFLPLLVGMFTIIPAMNLVIGIAGISGIAKSAQSKTVTDGNASIWSAARSGDTDAILGHLAAGMNIGEQDPDMGCTPLTWAVFAGKKESAEILIENGADVNARNRDGSPSLMAAAMLGRTELAGLLIESGADVAAADGKGLTPLVAAKVDMKTTHFVASLFGVQLDEAAVAKGRAETTALLSQRLEDLGLAIPTGKEGKDGLGGFVGMLWLLMVIPIFHHLWFLWHLCWLVAGFAVIAAIIDRFSLPRLPDWLVLSPARYLWLVPLTMIPAAFMKGFGPDTSAGLLPMPHVLGYYALFFGFGALYYGCNDPEGRISRWWWLALPLGLLVLFPLGLSFTMKTSEGNPVATSFLQAVYSWVMTFGFMGLFRKFFSGENRAIRYLSDSSYWLYLAHLPLIILGQLLVRDWQLPAILKFALICAVVSAFLLWTYDKLVRYRWIGTSLNGPRQRSPKAIVQPAG